MPKEIQLEEIPMEERLMEEVLPRLRALSVHQFANFCERLLSEAGFQYIWLTPNEIPASASGRGIFVIGNVMSQRVLLKCFQYSYITSEEIQ